MRKDHYQLVIAGGGNAALCAAITAAEQGLSVLIIEAAPKNMRGGNTRHTRNCRVAHDEARGTLTGPYAEEAFFDDLLRVTEGKTNEALARFCIRESKMLDLWLEQQGVRFQPPLGGTLNLGQTNAFFLGGGRAMLNALYHRAEDLGVDVMYETEVVDVEIENGVFRSALIKNAKHDHIVKGAAFVAASGGFEANIEWLREEWGPAADNFIIRGTPYNRGSLLRKLLAKGVRSVGDPKQCHAIALDARAPRFDGGIATRLDSVIFGVVVNQNGERFYDEGEDFWPKRYAIWGRLIAAQPQQIAYSIVDAKSIDLFMPSVYPPNRADSLAELADELGINRDAMLQEIKRFNDACHGGRFDHTCYDDCGTTAIEPPKTHWARPIDTPPFYGFALRPGITFTYLGVKTDCQARVELVEGGKAENLFAAGEIMAGNILGKGYIAGIGMTIGSVFGRVAGREAARYVSG